MYSKELEELIESALADGVITDKERAIIHKRAKAEAVDCDELDMVLDGRLEKMKKKQVNQTPAPPKPVESTKVGNVMKCPNCGEPYQPGAYKCTVCGHVFQNVRANRSSVRLAEGIQQRINTSRGKELSEKELQQICAYIKNFPVPTTKDDMLEFMLSLKPKTTELELHDITSAYNAKFKETVAKAKIIFADDPQVQAAVREVTKFKWSNLSYWEKLWICLGIGLVLSLLIIMLAGVK